MSKHSIQYSNDDDRAYGLAGMAISLAALDALDKVASISLDADDTMITFSQEYYYSLSPGISPKTSWNNLIGNYNITTAMALSNVMSRWLVRKGKDVPREIMDQLYAVISEEGRDTCCLDDDETQSVYNRIDSYMRRIFRNERLHPAIKEFVRILSLHRTLSGSQIADELRVLQLI